MKTNQILLNFLTLGHSLQQKKIDLFTTYKYIFNFSKIVPMQHVSDSVSTKKGNVLLAIAGSQCSHTCVIMWDLKRGTCIPFHFIMFNLEKLVYNQKYNNFFYCFIEKAIIIES